MSTFKEGCALGLYIIIGIIVAVIWLCIIMTLPGILLKLFGIAGLIIGIVLSLIIFVVGVGIFHWIVN